MKRLPCTVSSHRKGGGKSVIGSLLAIALVVAAPYAGSAIAGSMVAGGASTVIAAGVTVGQIGSVIGGIIGLVASSALMSVAPLYRDWETDRKSVV